MIFDTIKVLHLESTNACNLECPLCPRETNSNFNKEIINHLTINQITELFTKDIIVGLDRMFMCGSYGDPAAGKHSIDIFKYFRSINPNITLGMNTNGSLRNIDYWEDLGKNILNSPKDYIVFSIDGLEDTNHIYRINSSWDKIITNAQAFINSGGVAIWDMIIFDYNKHQVDIAQKLAKDLGFKGFNTKISKRTTSIEWLKPPIKIDNISEIDGVIECLAAKQKSLYVSAKGILYPCGWHGADFSNKQTVEKYEELKQSWNTDNCNSVCKKTCTTKNNLNNFTAQWQNKIQFN
jgi:MoaA/NifB/PqqE/SkfB family radical SAM enzyme